MDSANARSDDANTESRQVIEDDFQQAVWLIGCVLAAFVIGVVLGVLA